MSNEKIQICQALKAIKIMLKNRILMLRKICSSLTFPMIICDISTIKYSIVILNRLKAFYKYRYV